MRVRVYVSTCVCEYMCMRVRVYASTCVCEYVCCVYGSTRTYCNKVAQFTSQTLYAVNHHISSSACISWLFLCSHMIHTNK
jgi:hypothetical protein